VARAGEHEARRLRLNLRLEPPRGLRHGAPRAREPSAGEKEEEPFKDLGAPCARTGRAQALQREPRERGIGDVAQSALLLRGARRARGGAGICLMPGLNPGPE